MLPWLAVLAYLVTYQLKFFRRTVVEKESKCSQLLKRNGAKRKFFIMSTEFDKNISD